MGSHRNAGLREKPRFGRSLTLPAWGLFWLSACTSLYGVIAYTIVDADPGDLWGSAAMQDYVKSPGSDGASPYLRRRRPNTPTRRSHPFPTPPAGAG